MTDAQRHEVAASLRDIDEARRAIESQQNPPIERLFGRLRAAADTILRC